MSTEKLKRSSETIELGKSRGGKKGGGRELPRRKGKGNGCARKNLEGRSGVCFKGRCAGKTQNFVNPRGGKRMKGREGHPKKK